jgi:hypothetical protein
MQYQTPCYCKTRVPCDEKLVDDTLCGWRNIINPQKQNTTWLKAVDGDQKKDMGLLFLLFICFLAGYEHNRFL